jgi:hypothetical protein
VDRDVFPWFFVFWIALGITGFLLFFVNKDVKFKRRYFRWYVILVGVIFIGFACGTDGSWGALAFMGPAVALITYLNIRGTRFCDKCGRTIIDHMPFSRAEYCSRCGAQLLDAGADRTAP